ncbi:hypothetical protein H257_08441 [Aphanomyces astaci]|uniref:Methylmalonyl-CoA mutase alpha/beta chain catalytic domain-containing protein n=1 Tax=Aphanomyces astaci TaxID=112090 RepID=W4GF24_APHAT|nr:hypothetical protein H257_08441 [Aphanomyces astaci]ETV78275.1 hypothetical protein H257_08441 [Aphanomyces astaci]|eukprot:XP_009832612.1 hypothetical protein H257_08441 [Aphanomyces astaci]
MSCRQSVLAIDLDPAQLPGLCPYIRGPYSSMYAAELWTVRQYAGFCTGRGIERLLALGRRATRAECRVRFGDPSQVLIDGIPLDKMSVSMTMNGAVLSILAMYTVAAEEQGVDQKLLAGTIQNDILKEFMIRSSHRSRPCVSSSCLVHLDIFGYKLECMPKYNSISISGYDVQEAGAWNSRLLLPMASSTCMLPWPRAWTSPRACGFFFAIGMNFYMEVLIDGIPLDKMSVSMTMNGAYTVAAEEQGVDQKLLAGTIQNDILKEFMVRSSHRSRPGYLCVQVGVHAQVQFDLDFGVRRARSRRLELAFTIAGGIEYVHAAVAAGLDIAPRLWFFFAMGMNFYMEETKKNCDETEAEGVYNDVLAEVELFAERQGGCLWPRWVSTTEGPR